MLDLLNFVVCEQGGIQTPLGSSYWGCVLLFFFFPTPTATLETVPNYHYPKHQHLCWGNLCHGQGVLERKWTMPISPSQKFS